MSDSRMLFNAWWDEDVAIPNPFKQEPNESPYHYYARWAWHGRDRYIAALESKIDALNAEVASLAKDAALGKVVWKHIDAMNDLDEKHTAEYELNRFIASVMPVIDSHLKDPEG